MSRTIRTREFYSIRNVDGFSRIPFEFEMPFGVWRILLKFFSEGMVLGCQFGCFLGCPPGMFFRYKNVPLPRKVCNLHWVKAVRMTQLPHIFL